MEFHSSNYNEAFKKFTDWVESTEKRLNSACHCCPPINKQQQQRRLNIDTTTPLRNGFIKDIVITEEETDAITPIDETNKQQPESINHTNNPVFSSTPKNGSEVSKELNIINTDSANSSATSNNSKDQNCSIPPLDTANSIQSRIHSWKSVITYHQNLQCEVEDFGNQLNRELKRHMSEDKTCTKDQWNDANDLEERWHKLWLKSLEQLVVVERTKRCPKHNLTIIGKSPTSPANKSVARPQRRRPISYPNNFSERLEWDYQHTLSLTGCHKENGSQIDLDSVDEQVTRNLTEFGENYELWFGKEDEIACVALHSRPASVEPVERPELAKAVVSSNPNHRENADCNLLMLTTPSSIYSVDASKIPHNDRKLSAWRIFGFLFAIALLIFSALYQEPHHVHKSYCHSQPPV